MKGQKLMVGKLSGSKLHTVWQNYLKGLRSVLLFLDFPVYTVDSYKDFFTSDFSFSAIVVTPCFLHIIMVVR